MSKGISTAAVALLITLSPALDMRAQDTARLRVRVTVVPAITTSMTQNTHVPTDASQDAQFDWAGKQQNHFTTRTANAAELDNEWFNFSNPCASEGTKVPSGPHSTDPCEITINTVELVTE
jgi:hypothetical protein